MGSNPTVSAGEILTKSKFRRKPWEWLSLGFESRSATARGGVAGFFSRKIPVTKSHGFVKFLYGGVDEWFKSAVY